jgi:hypothetical protein
MLSTLNIKNVDKLVPTADDLKPKDPVTENMALMTGKPVKAFGYQDHEAHIATHMAMLQDPKIQQIAGQSPMYQQMMTAAQAHIAEHIGFAYKQHIEEQIGAPLPGDKEQLPEDVEFQVSKLIAAAAERLLAKDQAEVQQQQNEQAAQDPVVQQAMKELELKQMEIERKAQKDQAEIALRGQDMQLKDARERERIQAQTQTAAMAAQAKMADTKANLTSREFLEGVKIGAGALNERNTVPPQKNK